MMSDYHVDQPTSLAIIEHLTNMDGVLREIAVTYEVLIELLDQQERVLRAPTLNHQRQQLLEQARQAAQAALLISDSTQQLAIQSGDLTQRIVAID